ncbi:hypothetical protein FPQ18DRAFT_307730 [Pyronema domesticum]|nr:hypothetical protein FPQ18DRAFT_307730 [Pyronema domesticum]
MHIGVNRTAYYLPPSSPPISCSSYEHSNASAFSSEELHTCPAHEGLQLFTAHGSHCQDPEVRIENSAPEVIKDEEQQDLSRHTHKSDRILCFQHPHTAIETADSFVPSTAPSSPLPNTAITISLPEQQLGNESFLFYQSNSKELFFVPLQPLHPQGTGIKERGNTPLAALDTAPDHGGSITSASLYYVDVDGYLDEVVYNGNNWTQAIPTSACTNYFLDTFVGNGPASRLVYFQNTTDLFLVEVRVIIARENPPASSI